LIPKLDQISLIRAARGVVQPLFEGNPGGLSSHDAISVGHVGHSDQQRDREIETYVDHYFNPTDARALLDIMRKVGEPPKMKPLVHPVVRARVSVSSPVEKQRERRTRRGYVVGERYAVLIHEIIEGLGRENRHQPILRQLVPSPRSL
jgi:hypothetical protein